MRVLLDECVPDALRSELTGHHVTTVQRMRLAGLRNGALLRRASLEFDVFLTIDRSVFHQQTLPGQLALITLRIPNNRLATVLALSNAILAVLDTIQPGTHVVVEDR